MKISNIIKNFANVYNIKKTMKLASKTLIIIKKNQNLIFVIDALNLTFVTRRIRFLILKDEIFTQRDKYEIIILININNNKNFMSQSFVKNAQILEFKYAIIIMRVIDDHKIFFYDVYDFAFFLVDNEKRR